MRILLHDFGGYPFPIQLSRELADRGHEVMHAYCGSIKTTPGGEYERSPDDPQTLQIHPILLSEPLNKYSFVKRWRQENQYGHLITRTVGSFNPDVVISGNAPLDAQARLQAACRKRSIPFVFWLQDILSIAADRLLRKKLPGVGGLVGGHYLRMESKLLRRSDWTVLITEDFNPLMRDWGVQEHQMSVIENWAPLSDLPQCPKDNDWSRQHGLNETTNIVYSGTMGMKHNPQLLLDVAKSVAHRPGVRVVVVSSGLGAQWLRKAAEENKLNNLLVFDFEPFERVPQIFGSADILTAVLEPDAGIFSVPSKVLAYLCAGRALSLAIPPENLAARIVQRQGAGLIVAPDDNPGFVENAKTLLDDPQKREQLGRQARQYAEETFDIKRITDEFLAGLERVVDQRTPV